MERLVEKERNSGVSVSYTHLDVYKRQMLPFEQALPQAFSFSQYHSLSPLLHLVPVSYTHLDVYKRQATDWQAAVEITNLMKTLDAKDPCKYDYACLLYTSRQMDLYHQ